MTKCTVNRVHFDFDRFCSRILKRDVRREWVRSPHRHTRWTGKGKGHTTAGVKSCAFTRECGAKRDSHGQGFNTLHGIVGQFGHRLQLLPGVGGRRDALVRTTQQHHIAAHVQRTLNPTGRDGRRNCSAQREWRSASYTVCFTSAV